MSKTKWKVGDRCISLEGSLTGTVQKVESYDCIWIRWDDDLPGTDLNCAGKEDVRKKGSEYVRPTRQAANDYIKAVWPDTSTRFDPDRPCRGCGSVEVIIDRDNHFCRQCADPVEVQDLW
jgi:hypothetical protein